MSKRRPSGSPLPAAALAIPLLAFLAAFLIPPAADAVISPAGTVDANPQCFLESLSIDPLKNPADSLKEIADSPGNSEDSAENAQEDSPLTVPSNLSRDEKYKIFERLKELTKDVFSITASVSQEKQLSLLKETVSIQGTLYLKKPNMLRWEAVSPNASVTVVDGKTMTIYYPDTKEAQIHDLSENMAARNTMNFFISTLSGDLSKMEKRFKVDIFSNNGEIVFSLIPKSKIVKKHLSSLLIFYDEKTGLPLGSEAITPKGDRTLTRLTDIKINEEIGSETFRINLPADVIRKTDTGFRKSEAAK